MTAQGLPTLFERIMAGEIPCKKVFEDAHTFAFFDVNPQAPVHVLIIPKKPLASVAQAKESDVTLLGHVLLTAQKVGQLLGVEQSGYRLVFNTGPDAGQTVYHMHCHLLAGRPLAWPPG